ncbi:MAG: thioredoxin family protein [Bacteroidota bacterium]|nr:thioredoxin family protein [Bacteroidota bacterium]
MVFLLFLFAQFQLFSSENPIELGNVTWNRDLNLAQLASKKSGKPILILFQEVPGCGTCKNYGMNVLSHPLIVDAIENHFIPLAIFNNKDGSDKKTLQYFKEPAWNNPVVRIVNFELADLTKRISGDYSAYALVSGMNTTLLQSKIKIPAYLGLLEEELQCRQLGLEKITVGMYCFWSGEKNYGKLSGVVSTKAGFMSGAEVVEIEYCPKKISTSDLIKKGKEINCADKIYTNSPVILQTVKSNVVIKPMGIFKPDQENKYYLFHSTYRFLPLSDAQATKINSLISENQHCEHLLSPTQLRFLNYIKQHPTEKFKNYIGQDFFTSWKEFSNQI